MSPPKQKPGKSKQDYQTPPGILRAVSLRFGAISYDLAATAKNAAAEKFITPEEDSFKVDWSKLPGDVLWLNPPFAHIRPWAKKCQETQKIWREKNAHKKRIVMLTPASIGAEWFFDHVYPCALVIGIKPRLTFVGEKDPYPKDCMLSVFAGDRSTFGFEVWDWTLELQLHDQERHNEEMATRQ